MVGGSGLRLARESVVRQGPFFLALDARRDERSPTRESLVRLASRIEEPWLEELLPHLVERRRIVAYDARLQAVVARRVVLYHDLELRSDPDAAPDRAEAGKVLAAALADRAVEIFDGDEPSSRLLCRVATLRQAMPEHPWPAFDQADLARSLADACQGRRSLKELYQGALADALRASLVHPLDRILDAEAPETIAVPSGSRIRLIYRRDDPRPILAVRLQEMFGCADTPRIAAGRVKVLLHLLGPNFRPVQVTDDLASFWKNTYPQVRKDLRARYPKHAWPDHPLAAAPQAKGRPRR
jgi:ATP-dependent helicase HrpB